MKINKKEYYKQIALAYGHKEKDGNNEQLIMLGEGLYNRISLGDTSFKANADDWNKMKILSNELKNSIIGGK